MQKITLTPGQFSNRIHINDLVDEEYKVSIPKKAKRIHIQFKEERNLGPFKAKAVILTKNDEAKWICRPCGFYEDYGDNFYYLDGIEWESDDAAICPIGILKGMLTNPKAVAAYF